MKNNLPLAESRGREVVGQFTTEDGRFRFQRFIIRLTILPHHKFMPIMKRGRTSPERAEIGMLAFSRINHSIRGKMGKGFKSAGKKESKVKSC